MNWSEPRKQYKSKDNKLSGTNRKQTTYLNTPQKVHHNKEVHHSQGKQCSYHFNEYSHVCLSCRKSICLRCAITYCQQHIINAEQDILPSLRADLVESQVQPKQQQLLMRMRQSVQRQQYLRNKIQKIKVQIEQHFQQVITMLQNKKMQIIHYYQDIFQQYLQEYTLYDQDLSNKLQMLGRVRAHQNQLLTIEQVDAVALEVRRCTEDGKLQKKINRIFIGKDKIKVEKIWSERLLQKVLYEIENVPYKMSAQQTKKKRFITENSDQKINPFTAVVKNSTSNSRIPSGRKVSAETYKNIL